MTTSVALCSYNGGKYIAEQLDSILQQTVPVDEIVVCDDGSSDGTRGILEGYRNRHPGIFSLHYNDENLGYIKNFEKAINLCTGDLIFLSDQDDIWLPEKVARVKQAAKANPDKKVFAHRIDVLLENGGFFKGAFWNRPDFDVSWNNDQLLEFLIFKGNIFPGMSMALTSEAKDKYLPFQKIHRLVSHDYELALKAAAVNGFLIIDEVLTHYRKHDNQTIGVAVGGKKTPKALSLKVLNRRARGVTFVKLLTDSFHLDGKYYHNYKNKVKDDCSRHLASLPLHKRIAAFINLKYRYKTFDLLK